jgi:hypothetical protein
MQDNRDHDLSRDGASANSSSNYQTANVDMSLASPAIEPNESMSDNSGNSNKMTTAQIHFAPPPTFRGNAPLFASSISTTSPPRDAKPGPVQLRSVVTSSFSVEDSSLTQHDRYHTMPTMDRQHNELVARPGPWPFQEREHQHHHHSSHKYSQQDYGGALLAPASSEDSPLGRPFEAVRRSFSSSSTDPPLRRAFSVSSDPMMRRSFSSSSTDLGPPTQPIKRTFYHHARTGEPYSASSLPPDFMPPKRAKVGPSRKPDRVILPRNQTPLSPGDDAGGWFQQQHSSPSWNSPPMESNAFNFHHSVMPRTLSVPPPPSWTNGHHHQPPSSIAVTGAHHISSPNKLSVQVSPGNDDASPRGMWQHTSPSMHQWSSNPHTGASQHGRFWESSVATVGNQNRDDVESARNVEELRDSFDPEPYIGERTAENFASRHGIFRNPPHTMTMSYHQQSESQDKMKLVAEAASFAESVQGRELTGSFMEVEREPCSEHEEEKKEDDQPIVLLATPEDKVALSETLCVVREVSGNAIWILALCPM